MFSVFDLQDYLYSPTVPVIARILVFPMPWIHYGRVFNNVLSFIQPSSSPDSSSAPKHFTFADLAHRLPTQTVTMNGIVSHWSPPSPGLSLWMLLLSGLLYLVLAWYFGQVASGDLGASQRFYFPFNPEYWGFRFHKDVFVGDTLAQEQMSSVGSGDGLCSPSLWCAVYCCCGCGCDCGCDCDCGCGCGCDVGAVADAQERERSVRIYKLSKSYEKNTALKELSMVLHSNTLACILGQNGGARRCGSVSCGAVHLSSPRVSRLDSACSGVWRRWLL
jgi:hypothetical protein